MRRLLFGCLGITLLLAVVGGVLGYVYVVRPARQYLVALRQLASLGELEAQVRKRQPFEPPVSGELSPELVDRFVRVRQSVQAALGDEFVRLSRRAAELQASATASGRVRMRELLDASRDLAQVVSEAKRAQVAALNDAGLSVAEYEWVERQLYDAAGILVSSLDLTSLEAAFTSGADGIDVQRPERAPVPNRNEELVAPYLDQLKKWLPLSWLGL